MQEQVRLTSWLMYASVVASFCCIGQYGYHVGVLAAPTKYIQDFYNQSYTERYGEITQDIMDWLWAVTASSYLIGGALGAIAAPSISDIMGRKYGLLFVNFLPLSAALMSGCSRIANNFELIIMSRTVNGVYGGIAFGITPMFLAEISPIKYRGAVGSSQKVFLALCILLAQILGIFVLNTEDNWHILLSMTGVISAIHLLLFPPCPDSPRWLVITDFNTKSAKRAIKKYYGTSDVDWVVDEINREHREELTEEKVGVVGLFTNPNYRRPLLISVTIMSSIQLCGIPAVRV
ncbi:solute carrier family 2, facilitated glucose transporter member 1-like [Ptychodera flava]|uniref:solute carrier family 2, facilitated glucose transporter member 1-like n=1 Tax=Ptychodera flava TaxID=63121 RepID=UPI00396A9715